MALRRPGCEAGPSAGHSGNEDDAIDAVGPWERLHRGGGECAADEETAETDADEDDAVVVWLQVRGDGGGYLSAEVVGVGVAEAAGVWKLKGFGVWQVGMDGSRDIADGAGAAVGWGHDHGEGVGRVAGRESWVECGHGMLIVP